MPPVPWWIARVASLLAPEELGALTLGALWHLRERLQFVRDNVEPALLAIDVARAEGAGPAWAAFERREAAVGAALARCGGGWARRLRDGDLSPAAFRAGWEGLGYQRHAEGSGCPADDYLDGLLHLSRHAAFAEAAPFALLNLATRAERIADFLAVTEPGDDDVVFDLGSGSGKLAITVAASTRCAVHGVEIEPRYAAEAARSSAWLGVGNARFAAADVRDVDLAGGTIFYLYYPFRGPVARTIAARLGALARDKDITIYASGPVRAYGEHFLAEVDAGALALVGRRGEFGEVMLLASAR